MKRKGLQRETPQFFCRNCENVDPFDSLLVTRILACCLEWNENIPSMVIDQELIGRLTTEIHEVSSVGRRVLDQKMGPIGSDSPTEACHDFKVVALCVDLNDVRVQS